MKSLHFLQAEYWQSEVSKISACNIVSVKCSNMGHLLHAYAVNRLMHTRSQLEIIQMQIEDCAKKALNEKSRAKLMLIEARATKAYWKAFVVIADLHPNWHRLTSKSNDAINRLLAIGYHWLASKVTESLKTTSLTPQIGILHSPHNNNDSLVYDLEEIFRQPMVDKTILALVSRRAIEQITPGRLIIELNKRWAEHEWHAGRLKTWNAILQTEIMALKKATIAKKPYAPNSMPWTHRAKNKRLPKES